MADSDSDGGAALIGIILVILLVVLLIMAAVAAMVFIGSILGSGVGIWNYAKSLLANVRLEKPGVT